MPFNTPTINADDPQIDKVSDALVANRHIPLTLAQLSAITGIVSESSIASRIRDLRALGYVITRTAHPTATAGARIWQYTFSRFMF